MQTQITENNVYFYPKKLKISYSSLDEFKKILSVLFQQDIRLEEKLKQCNLFIKLILKELYRKGILREDHTMVISDPLVDKTIFLEAVEEAYKKILNTKITFTAPSKTQILKRHIIIALFMAKQHPIKDFINILLAKGTFYSKILNIEIDLRKHSHIKFRPTSELEAYIINILTRKALLSQECSIYTLRMYIPIIMELVIWYSRGIAIAENELEVNQKSLSAAIKIVDNYYITNPSFIKMLQSKLIGHIIKILN